jgi:predicted dehydrogenase
MINVGILGYGYWGPNLVRNFSEVTRMRVAAVCDHDEAKLALALGRHPSIRATTDERSVIDDPAIDAIAIATPVSTHFELALAALRAGKHVWLEKPMTETAEQARILVEEADRRNLVLLVDHTFVYTSAVAKMGELIRSGELGDVYYYDSIRINLGLFQRDVSVIADLAVHDFSILDFLLQEHPIAVTASGTNHFAGSPANLAYVTLFYGSGAIAHINISWLAPVKVRQILVGGSRRMVSYNDLEADEKVKIYDKGVDFTDDPLKIRDLRVGYRSGDVWVPKLAVTEALRVEAEHFVDCIVKGDIPRTGGEMGLRVVELVEAANASMRRRGETVEIAARIPEDAL